MQTSEVLQAMLDGVTDGVYFTDRDRRITHWNKGAEHLTGFSSEEVVGRCCRDRILVHVDENGKALCGADCPLSATLKDGKERQSEAYLRHKDGHRLPVTVRVSAVRDGDESAAITGAVEVFSDIAPPLLEQRYINDEENRTLYDKLTGLPNERYLEGAVWEHLSGLSGAGIAFGLLLAEIDDLDEINRTHGQDAGDEVLRIVGRTLTSSSRLTDALGRWSGDEFMCLVLADDWRGLEKAAERMCALVRESSPRYLGTTIPVTFSVGATMGRMDDDLHTLTKRAGAMLREASELGMDRVAVDKS